MAIFRRTQGVLHPRRLREWVAPRKGWSRGVRYLHARLQRLSGSPHSIALGFACGVLTSFSPFFGLHIVLAMLLAWMLRVSVVASALGTAVGNPLTFTIIVPSAVQAGRWLLGQQSQPGHSLAEVNEAMASPAVILVHWSEFLDSLLLPYAVGGMAIGLPASLGTYLVLRPVVAAYQLARRRLAIARRRKAAARRADAVAANTRNVQGTVGS